LLKNQLFILAREAARPPPDGFFKIPGKGFFYKLDDNADVLAGAAGAGSSFLGASFLDTVFPTIGFAATTGLAGIVDFTIGLFFNIDDEGFLTSSDSSLLALVPSYDASAVSASFLLTAITGSLSAAISSSSSSVFLATF
jgi:hypothetical protein